MHPSVVTILEVLAALLGTVAGVYAFTAFIDWRIDKRVADAEFLRKLANSVRPGVIFDENSSILVDQGGMKLIDALSVEVDPKDRLPSKITLVPKEHLAHAPLIQTLEVEAIDFTVTRGKGLSWIFELDYLMSNDQFDGRRRFRIEIL